jgi:hypothetical protein
MKTSKITPAQKLANIVNLAIVMAGGMLAIYMFSKALVAYQVFGF